VADRPGLLHQAHLGTLFLDEVDALPLAEQMMLLRALDEGEVLRVGAARPEHVDVRVVSSTSAPLERLVEDGTFNAELLRAISEVDLHLPGLRDRKGDVSYLAERLLEVLGPDRDSLVFSPDALAVMERYAWPGNVRELMSCVERAVALCSNDSIEVADLPQPLRDLADEDLDDRQLTAAPPPERSYPGTHSPLDADPDRVAEHANGDAILVPADGIISLMSYERMCLRAALQRSGGDKVKAARILGVGKSTFYRKLKLHGLA
jgi:DNA-binding NtrC family response regulator